MGLAGGNCIRSGAFWEWTDQGKIAQECHSGRWGIAEKTLQAIMVNATDNLEYLKLLLSFPVLVIHDSMQLKVQVKYHLEL